MHASFASYVCLYHRLVIDADRRAYEICWAYEICTKHNSITYAYTYIMGLWNMHISLAYDMGIFHEEFDNFYMIFGFETGPVQSGSQPTILSIQINFLLVGHLN